MKKCVVLLPLLALTGCIAPVAMGGASMVGLSAVEDRGLGGVASDQTLRAKLNVALLDKYEFSGVNLTIYRSRVLLTGIVPNEQTKREVLAIVKDTGGVRNIIDGLKIQIDDNLGENARDAWITMRLKTALYADQEIYAPNYLIHTFDKVVYIFGKAETPQELKRVLGHAREISGVRNVMNLIEGAEHGVSSKKLVLPAAPASQRRSLGEAETGGGAPKRLVLPPVVSAS